MQLFNHVLCFEAGWLIDNNIITMSQYVNMCNRKKLKIERRACRNTPALIAYESMPETVQEAIQLTLKGNPYDQIKFNFLEEFIEHNQEVAQFFDNYKLPNGRHISESTRKGYYYNAIVLDGIHNLIVSKQARKRSMGGKVAGSWDKISEATNSLNKILYPHDLPTNARSLQRKYKVYKEQGCEALMHQNLFKEYTNNTKINDRDKKSVMLELLGDPRNFDNAQIATEYNKIATELGWKTITDKAVLQWRKRFDLVSFAGRRGTAELYNRKLMQHKRSAPTCPLYYWTVDGWQAELMYKSKQLQKRKQKGEIKEVNVTTYWQRLTVVVVLDPFNKYPVGYAIGSHETPELIKAAFRNAAKHTAELFGSMYRAHQVQSDKYAKDTMRPTYEAMGKHYTMTSKRYSNAKAKVIEPYFAYLNKNYCQKMINWSGFGVTAKKDHQPNTEFLNKVHNLFPDREGCAQQIATMIETERQLKRAEFVYNIIEK